MAIQFPNNPQPVVNDQYVESDPPQDTDNQYTFGGTEYRYEALNNRWLAQAAGGATVVVSQDRPDPAAGTPGDLWWYCGDTGEDPGLFTIVADTTGNQQWVQSSPSALLAGSTGGGGGDSWPVQWVNRNVNTGAGLTQVLGLRVQNGTPLTGTFNIEHSGRYYIALYGAGGSGTLARGGTNNYATGGAGSVTFGQYDFAVGDTISYTLSPSGATDLGGGSSFSQPNTTPSDSTATFGDVTLTAPGGGNASTTTPGTGAALATGGQYNFAGTVGAFATVRNELTNTFSDFGFLNTEFGFGQIGNSDAASNASITGGGSALDVILLSPTPDTESSTAGGSTTVVNIGGSGGGGSPVILSFAGAGTFTDTTITTDFGPDDVTPGDSASYQGQEVWDTNVQSAENWLSWNATIPTTPGNSRDQQLFLNGILVSTITIDDTRTGGGETAMSGADAVLIPQAAIDARSGGQDTWRVIMNGVQGNAGMTTRNWNFRVAIYTH